MSALPSLSIALCTYEGAAFLGAQLQSYLDQTLLPSEVVVCDDRSTDETVAIVTSFARTAPFDVRLIVNESRLGSTRNFEKALRACRTDLVALSDQDDVWHANKLARIVDELRGEPDAGFAFSDARIVDDNVKPKGYGLWSAQGFTRRELRAMRSGRAPEVLLRHNVVTGATLVLRRAMLEPALPIPEDWIHDGWLALVLAAVAPVVAIDEPLIDYRQHSGNQVGSRRRGFLAQIARSGEISRSSYQVSADQYTEAAERLRLAAPVAIRDRLGAMALEKSRHLQARARHSRSLLVRTGEVLAELASGRHHRYDNGWKSVAKDLLGY